MEKESIDWFLAMAVVNGEKIRKREIIRKMKDDFFIWEDGCGYRGAYSEIWARFDPDKQEIPGLLFRINQFIKKE